MNVKRDISEPPEKTTADIIHTGGRVLSSLIPGGTELLNAIIMPPIEKRRTEWIKKIAEDVEVLKEKMEEFNPTKLSENESFVTTVLNATSFAMKTHQKEKLDALRNSIMNSALPNAPEDDLQSIYLNLVDAFTPLHIEFLEFFNTSINPTKYINKDYWGEWTDIGQAFWLLRGTQNGISKEMAKKIAKDLENSSLIDTFSGPMTIGPNYTSGWSVTELGKGFLHFIRSPFD